MYSRAVTMAAMAACSAQNPVPERLADANPAIVVARLCDQGGGHVAEEPAVHGMRVEHGLR